MLLKVNQAQINSRQSYITIITTTLAKGCHRVRSRETWYHWIIKSNQSSQVKQTSRDSIIESITWKLNLFVVPDFRFIPAFFRSGEFRCDEVLKFLPAQLSWIWQKVLQSNNIYPSARIFQSDWMLRTCSQKCNDHYAWRKCRFEFDTGCGN